MPLFRDKEMFKKELNTIRKKSLKEDARGGVDEQALNDVMDKIIEFAKSKNIDIDLSQMNRKDGNNVVIFSDRDSSRPHNNKNVRSFSLVIKAYYDPRQFIFYKIEFQAILTAFMFTTVDIITFRYDGKQLLTDW